MLPAPLADLVSKVRKGEPDPPSLLASLHEAMSGKLAVLIRMLLDAAGLR